MKLGQGVPGVLGRAARRAGAYAYGIVFGFPSERTYGNRPNYRDAADVKASQHLDGASVTRAQAEQRAVASPMHFGGGGQG